MQGPFQHHGLDGDSEVTRYRDRDQFIILDEDGDRKVTRDKDQFTILYYAGTGRLPGTATERDSLPT